MALDSPKLQEVLEDIQSGELQLPDFQRDWVWDDERIRALVGTVTLDYPLGVVMTLQTGGHSPFRARTLTGAEAAGAVNPSLLLLDGQQRLTSLFQALHSDQPVRTKDARNKPLECWYYVDIAKAVGTPADRDDAIVSVPEDKVLSISRKERLDLSSTELECRAGYFPLHFVFDIQRVNVWQRAFVMADDANWDLWSKFEEHVLKHVRSFLIPMIKLSSTTTLDAVCSVFERVNTGGVPLNVFELLTASYAGDRQYEREHNDYYRLPDEWRDIKKSLAAAYPVFDGDGLSSSDFLQAVTLVLTWERKQEVRGAAVSCKRRDLLKLPLADFRRLAPRVAEAFEWVGDFLQRQCIVRSGDVPYRTQLVPLAAVRAIIGDRIDEDSAAGEKINRWYWCGVLGEMYGGSTESRFTRDVEQLIGWLRGEPYVPDTITEAVFVSDRLDSLTTRNSAAYKGIYALLAKQGAVDWYYNEAPLNPALLLQYAVSVRQVFPKEWFTRQGIKDQRANSIVNKTPLSYRAGRIMTGPPGVYLKSLVAESGMRPEWFDDIVATHLMDPVALHEDDFERFYADRSRQLLELVNNAMGKRTVFRDASDR
ncbi:DUF262 domain-containing protein [Streptantibioticus rubrisoli]|uniref:DUF262 domain-containing protein n=1 Tax=Streptantibioticus rubrisoli TaxID=1387313 RepID=A0ABT1PD03_9ACTN|nr:DUF262 domain-containing protein [Streptantibioticus rubrisoli]MCQ4043240.1 DUF262 domain-containing protein [Streptantibioticus rubrisoli]